MILACIPSPNKAVSLKGSVASSECFYGDIFIQDYFIPKNELTWQGLNKRIRAKYECHGYIAFLDTHT